MPIIALTITLEQPLLLTSLLGDPNSTVSYDFIPGSTLRGLFAGRFRAAQQRANAQPGRSPTADQEDEDCFQRLFLRGQVRFLNAYPLDAQGQRCLPAPRALQTAKHDVGEVRTLINRAMTPETPPGRWKKISETFCSIPSANMGMQFVTPARTIAVHMQRDRQKGRAWLERIADDLELRHGTVFRYEALEAGQQFGTLMVVDDSVSDDDVNRLRALLQPERCWLGRSRSAGYGLARLAEHDDPAAWHEPVGNTSPADQIWTMTLLSPAILRSPMGEDIQQLDDATLSACLGCQVRQLPDRSFTASETVGGFNRHWGLPLPQRRALVMGSVIAFEVVGGTLDTAIIASSGIGDRRIDGFGRVAFNWLMEPQYQTPEDKKPQDDTAQEATEATAAAAPQLTFEPVPIPAALQPLARRTADRLFDAQIDAAILDFVQTYVWPQVQPGEQSGILPSNSQLARLHTLVRQATVTADIRMVKREFGQFRDTARNAFEHAPLANGKGSLEEWIKNLLEQPAEVWNELNLVGEPSVGNVTPSRDDKQTRRVTLRLLSAVLAAPAQRRKGNVPGQEVQA